MENAIGIGDRLRRIVQSFRTSITNFITYGCQNGFDQSFVSCIGVGLMTRFNTENGTNTEPSTIQYIVFAAKVGIVAGAASGIFGTIRQEFRRRRREHCDHNNEGHLSWCKRCTLRFMIDATFGSIGGFLGICVGCGIVDIMKGDTLSNNPTICTGSFWGFTDDDDCCRNNKLLDDINIVILAVIINELSYLLNVDCEPYYSRMKGIQTQTEQEIAFNIQTQTEQEIAFNIQTQTEQEIAFKRGLFENITSAMNRVTRHESYGEMLREYLLKNSSIPQLSLYHTSPDSGNIRSESPTLPPQQTMETSRNKILDNLNEIAQKALAGSSKMVISHLPFDVHLTVHSNQKRINLVVIHNTRGIILAHLLAVQNDCVTSEIKQSLAHFKEANRILKILSRDHRNITITNVLIVQNIEKLKAIAMGEDIMQDICYCLEVGGISEAEQLHRCIDETKATENTEEWFEQLISNIQGSDVMTETYNEIVLRLYGISSTVDVYRLPLSRLEIHAEFENCEMSTVQLTPWQLQILSSPERLMFLTGPPGTGKTLILILKGVQWLQEGHDVYVISTWYKSPASSFVIEYQMRKTFQMLSPLKSKVIRRHYDFKIKENMTRAREELKSKAVEGQLYLIVDEPGPDIWEDAFTVFTKFTEGNFKQSLTKTDAITCISHALGDSEKVVSEKYDKLFKSEEVVPLGQFQRLYISFNTKNVFKDFCQFISEEIPLLHLWVSSTDPFIRDENLVEGKVRTPMRASRDVLNEVENCSLIKNGYVNNYSETRPLFRQTSSVDRLCHRDRGHSSKLPENCRECGQEIAKILKNKFHFGELEKGMSTFQQFRDVLVICENASEVSGLVDGLQECEIFINKVRVVKRDADMGAIKDTALALSNMITISNYLHVHGLERNIVVVAGDQTWENEYSTLYDVSRAAAHLILIDI